MAILKIRDDKGVITNIAAIRGENGKSPIIKNGTWWIYDDDKKEYVDTGLGAEKETILTKDNIEAVLTGTITSHNHDDVYIKDAPSDSKQYVRYNGEWSAIDFSSANFATKEELNTKVDKVEGKVLSTNDYTTEEKNKLAGIAAGAEVNVNADWNATEGDALILNKPTIPSNVSELTNDNGYITKDVSDLTNYSTTNTVNQAINNAVSSKVDTSSISAVATSGDYNDLNNKPIIPSSTSELINDSNYITSSEVDTKINSAVTAVYKVRGSVDNYESLPISNVVVGDVYNLLDTGSNYVCISIDPIIWDKLSETIDLSSYSTTEQNDAKYQLKGDYITSIPDEYVTDTELEAKGYATTTSVETALATKLDSSAYTAATSTTSGYMLSKDYIKLSGIEENADVNIIEAITVNGDAVSVTDKTAAIEVKEYTHPKFTKHDAGLYKITVNDEGHASNATVVTKDDITALGIPAQDTVYTHPSYVPREAGMYKVTVDSTGHVSNVAVVTKADITSLGIPAQDTVYTHPSYTPQSEGLYKITVNELGHVSGVGAVAKDDIVALGIPAQDTTYSEGTGLSFSGTTINHASSITAGTAGSSSATSGSNTISIPYVTYNDTGHITGAGNSTHTINEATTSASGLMPSSDKTKMDRLESYTTATTVASLDVNYQTIYVTLSENASLSASGTGAAYNGRSITAYVYTASSVTITIPTSGDYVSMCGSSFTTTADGWVEFSLVCVNGVWHIAKLEAE